MPWFEYSGVTSGGTSMTGRIDAADHDRAREELGKLGVELHDLKGADAPPPKTSRISGEDLIFFNEQLASLSEAGIALDEGFAQLAHDVQSPRLKRWIQELVADLKQGIPLEQAIESREKGLPLLYSRVVRAGVESRQLPATLLSLNQHLRLVGTTRRIIWEAAAYPLVVALLAGALVSFFMLAIVPQFEEIYADFSLRLPMPTMMLLSLSRHFVPVLIAVAVCLFLIFAAGRAIRLTVKGRLWRDRIVWKLPVIGAIQRASLLARFFRGVSTAIGSGLTLPDALRLGADATGSTLLTTDAGTLATQVEQGQSVFVANQSSKAIPAIFGFCVQTALGRDTLLSSISKLAEAYEHRAEYSQSMLRTLLLPMLVIVLGGFLLYCIAGLFMPLVNLINSMSGG